MLSQMICGVALALSPALGTIYEVGDGQPYPNISDVPRESIRAGNVVLIHWRIQPYHEKWVITAAGTVGSPVIVRGVPGPGGQLPVIDGEDATTRLALDYWNENRSVIKIGGSGIPANVVPTHVIVENLDIRGARPPNTFVDDAGNNGSYATNAAAIHVERGANVTIRNCIMRESGNGLFVSSSEQEAARDILIEGNYLHSNGNVGSIFHHNAYTAGVGMIYQFNRFGSLEAGADGNNLKDRSAGLIVRYNWIEGGNRQLDLVDAEDSTLIQDDPSYETTLVFGNVLIEPDGAGNSQIAHYGGDSGNTGAYRKGTLHFYHNTVISTRTGNTTLFRLSTGDEHCDARNNIFFTTASGNHLAILDEDGVIDLSHNWHKPGWVGSHSGLSGVINDDGTSIVSDDPGFADDLTQDYALADASPCLDAAGPVHADTDLPNDQYRPHRRSELRPIIAKSPDVGALEQRRAEDVNGDGVVDISDLLILFGEWGPCPLPPHACEADVERNDDIDIADLLLLIAGWD